MLSYGLLRPNCLFPSAGVQLVFSSFSQLVENCVCLLRNLSYQVHREVPSCERYAETAPINQGPAPGTHKGGCFGSRKGKGQYQADRTGVSLKCLRLLVAEALYADFHTLPLFPFPLLSPCFPPSTHPSFLDEWFSKGKILLCVLGLSDLTNAD